MDDVQIAVDMMPSDQQSSGPPLPETTHEFSLPHVGSLEGSTPIVTSVPKVEGAGCSSLVDSTEEMKKGKEILPPLKIQVTASQSEPISASVVERDVSSMILDEVPGGELFQRIEPTSLDPQADGPLDRPLNVTDALSYLDAVKIQFQDEPDVYNRFLDIMKEFKNEVIDTPGVIQRVSRLFNGHPSLIRGFNTFLPVGYRIECTIDAHDTNTIRVTTPTGTTMQTTIEAEKRPFSRSERRPAPTVHLPEAHASAPSPDPRSMPIDGQAIEPAVQYVQKIKQRCDPEVYRQFLDILSRYHSQPDSIDEEEVSRQIAHLFKDAPDLRADFRIFMPERTQQNLDDPIFLGAAESRAGTNTPLGDSKGKRKLDSVMASASALPQKRKRKPAEKERERESRESVAAKPIATASNSKSKHADSATTYSQRNRPPSPRRASQAPPPPARMMSANDDSQFFDNVRHMLDNRETYNEFLKIVNLFTQDFIDTARLIKESRNFLGDGELMKQFKNILGWTERKEQEAFEAEQQAHFGWTRPLIAGTLQRPTQAELNMRYGSYRRLPSPEVNVQCSGRDEMCRSVLNDEWVSHATWSTDDAGFSAHRKNIYEEALHRSEEERHEYDFHIEAIVRTIALLEPINNKIAQLNLEERNAFKLKPNMGGSWKSIHSRVVKKIYGREAGLEVMQAMQETPSLAIPVVLQRLKQKEDEWKRAQREWNKVWREVDARNYMKSLDHQAIYFKSDDKKAITPKAFVSQIEAAREEQMAKRASLIDPLFSRTRPRYQLEFSIDNVPVLQDVLKLTFSFLDRTQAQINFSERKKIEGFLRSFVPLFFTLDSVTFNSAFVVLQETVDSEVSDETASNADELEASSNYSGSSRPARNGRKAAGNMSSGGDLRKKLLKSEQAKSSRKTRAQDASPATSRLASPAPVDEESRTEMQRKLSRRNIFFTNTSFYVLLRLVEVLYSRLLMFKTVVAKAATEGFQRLNPTVYNLGVLEQINDRATTTEHYYDLLLESLERLFDNEIEPHVFEDQMRYMFGTKDAYKSFTIDKVVGGIIKQVQNILMDSRSQELLEILKRERALLLSLTTQDQINSRRSAEKVLGPDENLFRVDWLPESRTMTIQLIGKDDSSFDDSEVLTGRWQAYIDSFVSNDTTDGVLPSKVKNPYLRRNLPLGIRESQPNVITRDSLEIKICVRTYRLFFVSHTEDFLWKFSSKEEVKKAKEDLTARQRLRRKWLESAKKRC